MSDEWRVRRAAAEDAEALALVGAATFLESFAGTLAANAIIGHCTAHHRAEAYAAALDAGAAAWLAEADPGGAPVGYVLLHKPDLVDIATTPDDLELKRIYAFSRYHGSGLGGALMDAAADEARNRGATRLLLGVYAGNARALSFYARQGFVQAGTRRFQVGPQIYDDFILAMPLPRPGA